MEDYRARVVLLHFRATYCLPCRDEMPGLESLWQHYGKDGLAVPGVAVDRGAMCAVRDFAQEFGVTFPILDDRSGTVRKHYEVRDLPTSHLVSRDGRISGRAIGMRDRDSVPARAYVESLLRQ